MVCHPKETLWLWATSATLESIYTEECRSPGRSAWRCRAHRPGFPV